MGELLFSHQKTTCCVQYLSNEFVILNFQILQPEARYHYPQNSALGADQTLDLAQL